MMEHMHQKVSDFSLHFHLEPNKKPHYLGLVHFKTNSNGQFSGCYINEHPNPEVNAVISEAVNAELLDALTLQLEKSYNSFSGYLGVDAMLITQNGNHKIHPCVEINPRFTMGLLTLELRKLIPNTNAYWEIIFSKKGCLYIEESPDIVALTPIDKDSRFAAILHLKA